MVDAKYAPWFDKIRGINVGVKDEELVGGDVKELDAWLDQVEKELTPLIQSNDKKLSQALHKVNKNLLSRTFLVGDTVTLGDLVFYTLLHPLVAQWSDKDRLIFVALTRWFDHIQHIITSGALPLVNINVDIPFEPKKQPAKPAAKPAGKQAAKEGSSKGEGKAEHAPHPLPVNDEKEEEKKEHDQMIARTHASEFSTSTAAAVAEGEKELEKGGGEKKDLETRPKEHKVADQIKKEKGKQPQQPKKAAAPAVPQPQLSATEDISRLDIRVGKIIACKKHENADSLYVEQIDVGEEAPRQVVSGLVKFVPLDDMQNRMVLLLCNLKPSNLKSVRSMAMVLAASNEDHTKVELVDPPADAKIGERVTFAGYSGDPEKVLKKETLDIVLADLKTNDGLVATYKGVPFTTSAGVCTVKSIANGGIR